MGLLCVYNLTGSIRDGRALTAPDRAVSHVQLEGGVVAFWPAEIEQQQGKHGIVFLILH